MKVEIEADHLAAMEAVEKCAEISAEWFGRWLEKDGRGKRR